MMTRFPVANLPPPFFLLVQRFFSVSPSFRLPGAILTETRRDILKRETCRHRRRRLLLLLLLRLLRLRARGVGIERRSAVTIIDVGDSFSRGRALPGRLKRHLQRERMKNGVDRSFGGSARFSLCLLFVCACVCVGIASAWPLSGKRGRCDSP